MITNAQADHIKFNADMESDMPTPAMITSTPDLGPIERMMAEFGKPIPPRFRELEVSDEHAVYLLTLVADDLLAKRRRNEKSDYVALEMQAALNSLVSA